MYAAKRGRKGSYVLFSSGMTLVTDGPPTQRHGVPTPG
jgi:hypothetical protein